MTIFSVDCEYSGPYPIRYNLLSFGVIAYTDEGEYLGEMDQIVPNRHISWDPNTLIFWKNQGEMFDRLLAQVDAASRNYTQADVAHALLRFVERYHSTTNNGFATFLADPANADFPWIDVLLQENGYTNPFGYKGLCLGSMIREKLGVKLYDRVRDWYPSAEPHNPLEDARAQAKTYFDLLNPDFDVEAMKATVVKK